MLNAQHNHIVSPVEAGSFSGTVKISLLVYFLIWALAPWLIIDSHFLDVTEGISWGREWQLGYYKHPPLSSWVLYSFYYLFGNVGPYLLSQLCILLTLTLVWQLGRSIYRESGDNLRVRLGTLSLLLIFYFTWPSIEFNHNLAQMPVWAGLTLCFYRAVHGDLDKATAYWLSTGTLAGVALLTKYSSVVLILSLALYLATSQQTRSWFRRPVFWCSALIALLIFSPHLWWLMDHNFLPFEYASARATLGKPWNAWLPFRFLLVQILNHLFLILALMVCGLPFFRHLRQASDTKADCRRYWLRKPPAILFLMFAGLGPALLTSFASLVLQMKTVDMWGMPMWNLSGLLVFSFLNRTWFERYSGRFQTLLVMFLAMVTVAMLLVHAGQGPAFKQLARSNWPSEAMSEQALAAWKGVSTCPLTSVASEYWYSGLITNHLNPQQNTGIQPSMLISKNLSLTPWVSLPDLSKQGVLLVWQEGRSSYQHMLDQALLSVPGMTISTGLLQIPWPDLVQRPPLVLNWRAYVPTDCAR